MATSGNDYALNTFSNEHVGKTIFDSFGWIIGKIIGVTVNSQKNKSVIIELNSGGLITCDYIDVQFDNNTAILDNSWKTKVENLTDELNLIIKKISALNELEKDTEISEVYSDLEKEFENQKKILLEKRRILLDKIKERIEIINPQIKEAYKYDAQIKISYHVGNIEGETYEYSHKSLKLMIDKLLSEENDLKLSLNILTNSLSTLPSEPLKLLTPSTPSISSPLRVKVQ